MSEKKKGFNKATTYLTNLDWKKDIFEDIDGKENRELAKERLIYLFESMEDILLHNGSQKISGNMEIDYPVKIMIRQIITMRNEPDINVDLQIAKMKAENEKISSQAVADKLIEMGKQITASGVRSKEGWKNPDKFLTVLSEKESVDSVDSTVNGNNKWQF